MRHIIGKSVQGRDLILHANHPMWGNAAPPDPGKSTLLIGGTHGDERATVTLLDNFSIEHLDSHRIGDPVAVLCLHNPDGHAADTRYNAHGVDLNRNFPHHWSPESDEPSGPGPLSEPETSALHAFILDRRPAKIVSLHWALAELDADGPQSAGLALAMWNALSGAERKSYRLRVHRPGTPVQGFCPGSMGQWCGNGLIYPDGSRPAMVTLELPYHPQGLARPDPLPADHLESVRALWRTRPEAYLAGVQGPVHRMLEAACRLEQAWPGPLMSSGMPPETNRPSGPRERPDTDGTPEAD